MTVLYIGRDVSLVGSRAMDTKEELSVFEKASIVHTDALNKHYVFFF